MNIFTNNYYFVADFFLRSNNHEREPRQLRSIGLLAVPEFVIKFSETWMDSKYRERSPSYGQMFLTPTRNTSAWSNFKIVCFIFSKSLLLDNDWREYITKSLPSVHLQISS